jgi:tartrate dehydratase beta subunit/fumarate hydratase class I family protein
VQDSFRCEAVPLEQASKRGVGEEPNVVALDGKVPVKRDKCDRHILEQSMKGRRLG